MNIINNIVERVLSENLFYNYVLIYIETFKFIFILKRT